MKKIIIIAFFILALPFLSYGATALWSPPTQNTDGSPLTDLAGFNFYETTIAKTKINTTLIPVSICTGSPSTCTWPVPAGVAIKGDTFVVTAVDAIGGESGDSNTATYAVKPKAPATLIVQ